MVFRIRQLTQIGLISFVVVVPFRANAEKALDLPPVGSVSGDAVEASAAALRKCEEALTAARKGKASETARGAIGLAGGSGGGGDPDNVANTEALSGASGALRGEAGEIEKFSGEFDKEIYAKTKEKVDALDPASPDFDISKLTLSALEGCKGDLAREAYERRGMAEKTDELASKGKEGSDDRGNKDGSGGGKDGAGGGGGEQAGGGGEQGGEKGGGGGGGMPSIPQMGGDDSQQAQNIQPPQIPETCQNGLSKDPSCQPQAAPAPPLYSAVGKDSDPNKLANKSSANTTTGSTTNDSTTQTPGQTVGAAVASMAGLASGGGGGGGLGGGSSQPANAAANNRGTDQGDAIKADVLNGSGYGGGSGGGSFGSSSSSSLKPLSSASAYSIASKMASKMGIRGRAPASTFSDGVTGSHGLDLWQKIRRRYAAQGRLVP